MKILFLTFYFEPDLCAGSFRNTPLFKELLNNLREDDFLHVITTQPNRYSSFKSKAATIETGKNYCIERITIPTHNSGFIDQTKAFYVYYVNVLKLTQKNNYDLVFASSSRLFTAFLGKIIAQKKKAKLYLDIRDIFVDTISDIINNKIIQVPLKFLLSAVEKYTFSNANHINLVSEGFKEYFTKYFKPSYSFFTNGIDDEFVNINKVAHRKSENKDKLIITYAGNIGSGQGLEKIIPNAAKLLGQKYIFRIIGDGGKKSVLVDKITEFSLFNVEVINPVSRNDLFKYYQESDFLFLHLNNLEAFKKVLPSKIFEYAAFNKPIIAGVSGYAQKFIQSNLDNFILFEPTNTDDFVAKLLAFKVKECDRCFFVEKFSRKNIIKKMSESILSC